MKFRKEVRLRKRGEFFMGGSVRKYGRYLAVDVKLNHLLHPRLGITATRRFGNAVKRNRFKRIVREAFRSSFHKLKLGIDINVRPRGRAQHASSQQVAQELLALLPLGFDVLNDVRDVGLKR